MAVDERQLLADRACHQRPLGQKRTLISWLKDLDTDSSAPELKGGTEMRVYSHIVQITALAVRVGPRLILVR